MTASRENGLLESLRDNVIGEFREHLREAIEEAFREADDVLFDWAYGQSMKGRGQECLDLLRMLRSRKESFVEEFIRQFERGPSRKKVDRTAPISLELIPDEQVDLKGAVESFVRAVNVRCGAVEQELGYRLQQLDEGAQGVSALLSIEHIAESFRSGAAELGLDPTMQIVLFKLFERCAAPAISTGYARIARSIEGSGVQFAAPHVVAGAPGGAGYPPNSERPDGGAAGVHEKRFNAEQERTTHTVAPDGSQQTVTETQRVGFVDSRVIAQYLMGAPVSGSHGQGGSQPAAGGSWVPAATGIPVMGHAPGAQAAQVPDAANYAIAQAPLLQQVLGMYQVPVDQLSRLAQPLARIGASDPSVFVDANHPVRSLLDQAFSDGASDDPDQKELVGELPDVLADMSDGLELPEDWDAGTASLPDADSVRASIEESRKRRKQNRLREATLWARESLSFALEDALMVKGGMNWFRAVFVPWLTWVRLREKQGDGLRDQVWTAIEDLVPLLSPRYVEDSSDAMDEALGSLVKRLLSAGAREDDLDRICARFRELHGHALATAERHRFGGGDDEGIGRLSVPEDEATDDVQAADEAVRVDAEVRLDSEPRDPVEGDSADAAPPLADHPPAAAPEPAPQEAAAEVVNAPGAVGSQAVPKVLKGVTARSQRRERERELLDYLSGHCSGPDLWWRLSGEDGKQAYGKLEAVPKAGSAFAFTPMFGSDPMRIEWAVMLGCLEKGANRPLRCTKQKRDRIQSLAKACRDASHSASGESPAQRAAVG